MQVIIPVGYTVDSTDVPSPDTGAGEEAWVHDTVYNRGDILHRPNSPTTAGEGSLYIVTEDVTTSGIGEPPEYIINLPDQPNIVKAWAYYGPDNAGAMFDAAKGTVTTADSGLEVVLEIATGEIADSICLDDVTADSVQIEVLDGVTVEYDETYELADDTPVEDWYDWFFDPVITARTLVVRDLPLIPGASIRVTFRNAGDTGDVSCGTCMPGRKVDFGDTQWECVTSINNYSTKVVNPYSGRSAISEGTFSQRIDCKVSGATDMIDSVVRELIRIRNTPCFWLGAPGQFNSLTAYGYVRDWSQPFSPTKSLLNLVIESLEGT